MTRAMVMAVGPHLQDLDDRDFGPARIDRAIPDHSCLALEDLFGRQSPPSAATQTAIDAARGQGYDSGRAAGKAEAEQDFSVRLETNASQLSEQYAVERARWRAQESEALASQIAGELMRIEHGIAEIVARILRPFLSAAVTQHITSEFHAHVEKALSKCTDLKVRARLPDWLAGDMAAALARRGVAMQIEDAGDGEAHIEIDGTVLRSNRSAWLAVLQGDAR